MVDDSKQYEALTHSKRVSVSYSMKSFRFRLTYFSRMILTVRRTLTLANSCRLTHEPNGYILRSFLKV